MAFRDDGESYNHYTNGNWEGIVSRVVADMVANTTPVKRRRGALDDRAARHVPKGPSTVPHPRRLQPRRRGRWTWWLAAAAVLAAIWIVWAVDAPPEAPPRPAGVARAASGSEPRAASAAAVRAPFSAAGLQARQAQRRCGGSGSSARRPRSTPIGNRRAIRPSRNRSPRVRTRPTRTNRSAKSTRSERPTASPPKG